MEHQCVSGLIIVNEAPCDSCGRLMKYGERYGYIAVEGQPPERFCEACSREKGFLRETKDERGESIETFL